MPAPTLPPFIDYLLAKQSVDERALNPRVWDQFAARLKARAAKAPLEILEVGGGIGTMLTRLLTHAALPNCHYTIVDHNAQLIGYAQEYLETWAAEAGWQLVKCGSHCYELQKAPRRITVSTRNTDIFALLHSQQAHWDALIAHAVLDLFHLPRDLPRLLAALKPQGLLYTTINYDGLTIFEPAFMPAFEQRLLAGYNRSMDARVTDGQSSGDSRAGRHLWAKLRQNGVDLLDIGASDWVVFPHKTGYAHDEAKFLHHLLNFIQAEMQKHPDIHPNQLEAWLTKRRQQITDGELFCIVHQMDYLGILI